MQSQSRAAGQNIGCRTGDAELQGPNVIGMPKKSRDPVRGSGHRVRLEQGRRRAKTLVVFWFLRYSAIFQLFFYIFWPLARPKHAKKAVIQSAASAASAKGGCASSRLDHSLKFYVIRGGCGSSRLIHGFSNSVYRTHTFLTMLLATVQCFLTAF